MPSNKGKKALKKGGKGGEGKGPSKKSQRNQEVLDTIGDQENAEIHPQLSWGRVTGVHSIGKKPRVVVDSHAHGRLPASVLAEKQIASLLSSLANHQPIVLVEFVPSRNSFNILAVVDDDTSSTEYLLRPASDLLALVRGIAYVVVQHVGRDCDGFLWIPDGEVRIAAHGDCTFLWIHAIRARMVGGGHRDKAFNRHAAFQDPFRKEQRHADFKPRYTVCHIFERGGITFR